MVRPVGGGDPTAAGPRRIQRALGAVAVAAVLAGTAVATSSAVHDARQVADRRSSSLATEAVAAVDNLVGAAVSALRGSGALAGADGTVDDRDFDAFAEGLLGGSVSAVALGRVVPGADRAAFEAAEGPILRRRPGGGLAPADPAPVHYPIVEIVSARDAIRTEGLDYASEPVRAETVERARDEGTTTLSAPTLLQSNGHPGFLVVAPLFRRGAAVATIEQRRAAFAGFVTVGYDAAVVLDDLRQALPASGALRVTDAGRKLFASGELGTADIHTTEVAVPGRTWQIEVRAAGTASMTLARVIVAAGLATAIGLLALFAISARYERRLRAAYAAERRAQRRSQALAGLASRLSGSLSSREVAAALLDELPPSTVGAGGAVVASAAVDAGADADHVLAATGLLAGTTGDLDAVLASRDLEGRASVVPLAAAGTTAGNLVVVHGSLRPIDDDERSFLRAVGAMGARALRRARRYDTARDVSEVLQRALLPAALPDRDDVAVAVRYLPATGGIAVGGDWYDVFPVAGDRVALVVGDVVGRGIRAAAAMGQLRSGLRALAATVPEPAELLAAFEAHVPTIADARCATVVYAVLDPATSTLTYTRAGHLPPLLLHPGAEAALLDGALSPPLGVTRPARPSSATVAVAPGDTIVLYTDGIVERRGEPITAALERLRGVATAATGLAPEACCDAVVGALLDPARADDVAVLAVQLCTRPAPAADPPTLPAWRPRSSSSMTTR